MLRQLWLAGLFCLVLTEKSFGSYNPLSSGEALGSCSYQLAEIFDDENYPIWESFVKLHPFKRLKVTSLAVKPPPGEFHLDEPFNLSLNRNQARELYFFILSLWPKKDMDSLAKALDHVNSKNIDERQFQKNLKITRGWLKRLRSAAITLSTDHEAQDDLDRLIVIMGRIKDAVRIERDNREAMRWIPQLKEFLSEDSRTNIAREIVRFTPSTKESFDNWLKDELSNVDSSLRDEEITPRQFHDLRKFVGHLGSMFSAFFALDPTVENHNYFLFLNSLNNKMGHFNDELVGTSKPVRIPKDIRSGLKELLKNIVY